MGAVLGYARISTGDQDLNARTLRLKAAGATRVFEDIVSGRVFEWLGLSALLDYAREGGRRVIVRLDRLGHSLREPFDMVETLKGRGAALVSLEEQIDTASAAGELVFHVFGAIAQFERRLIAERTRDGIAARAEGRLPRRPRLPREVAGRAQRGRIRTITAVALARRPASDSAKSAP